MINITRTNTPESVRSDLENSRVFQYPITAQRVVAKAMPSVYAAKGKSFSTEMRCRAQHQEAICALVSDPFERRSSDREIAMPAPAKTNSQMV